MSGSLFLFLGAISCALASAFFYLLAVRSGDRKLARMTAVPSWSAASLPFSW